MIILANMGGIAPMMTPASLSDRLAQTAENLVLYKGGVTPLKDAVTVATPTKSGTKKSIYRFGISQPEGQYWFSWTTQVNVVRGPIAVAFFSTPDKRHLTRFKWLETIDNDLTGDKDEGWRQVRLIGTDPFTWLNRTRWLWRNGGNSVNYNMLGCKEEPVTQVSDYLWRNASGYWMYRKPVWITSKRFIDLYFGWQILGPKLGRCKFVFTIRLKTKP